MSVVLLSLAMVSMAGAQDALKQPTPDSVSATAPMMGPAKTPERPPSVYYTGEGRFEIVVMDPADAVGALDVGRVVWSTLSGPLGLPAGGYSKPVSVRLVPADGWAEDAPFTVTAEPPGLVLVRVRWSKDVEPRILRRAFVQGLILRQAISWHGTLPTLTVPLWLEHACAALSQVRERPAMLDQFQQDSAAIATPPPLRSLLLWKRGALESRAWELSSLWLLMQLQTEPGDVGRWNAWLRAVTRGASPLEELPRCYPGLWSDFSAMELWWQTSFQFQRRVRGTPLMTPEASRAWLADRSRWLVLKDGREVVLPLGELVELRKETWARKEMSNRMQQSGAVLGAIHPYYANAAISLGRLYEAASKGDAKASQAALADFERDAVDGRELEDTVNEILDTAPRE